MEQNFICNDTTAVVTTTKGKVRGYQYNEIEIYKGIPYAKAQRFHAPEEVDAWDGIMDATSYGFVCPLLETGKPNGELMVPHRYWAMDEDCLNLNIWTPGSQGKKYPVLVWLHGGGYEAGSSIEQLAYEGENMCRLGQVVVVSLNHRLNILGYCDLSEFGEEYKNSGNAGTDDIIAALRWMKENIANFGGDAENITVFGQSGGGAKVTTLLQTPAADGLFTKGINMSGVLDLLADGVGSGKALVKALMEELSLTQVKELEVVPYQQLADAYKKVKPQLLAAGKYVGGTPFVNEFYVGSPDKVGFRKETAAIPLMVGSVFGEFTSFAPAKYNRNTMTEEEARQVLLELFGADTADKMAQLFHSAYPKRHLIDILNLDFIFRAPEQQYIRLRSAQNDATYSYLFNQDMELDGGRTPWHCADIPYVFHNTCLVPVTQKAGVTEKLENQIFSCVMAFAKTGNPNCSEIPNWPASKPGAEQTMVFGEETQVRCNFDAELVPLWAQNMGPVFAREMQERMGQVQH